MMLLGFFHVHHHFIGDVGFAGPNESGINEAYYEDVEFILELLEEECIITNVDSVSGDLLSAEDIEAFEPSEDCEEMMMDMEESE
ncbi:MAG: hypothetical protein AAFV93_13595 [Chloroflexota bacterium]